MNEQMTAPVFSWIEIDCPCCGIDFDIEPHEITPELRCGCGALWTREVLADGNAYDEAARVVENPFATTSRLTAWTI